MSGYAFTGISRTYVLAAILLILVAVSALAQSRAATAEPNGFIDSFAVANGISLMEIDYRGSNNDPAEKVGDLIEFEVLSPPGARFTNGATTITVPLGGTACTAEADPAPTDSLARCFAIVELTSTEAGEAEVIATNLAFPGDGLIFNALFVQPRAVVPNVDTWAVGRRNEDAVNVQNVGSEEANVVMSFSNSSGEVAKRVTTLAPGASFLFNTWVDPQMPTFSGSVTIGSDRPIAATSLHTYRASDGRIRTTTQRALPFERFGEGRTFTLPYIANQLEGNYNTQFIVTNTGIEPSCIRVTYHFVAGAGAVGPEGRPSLAHTGLPTAGCAAGGLVVPPGTERVFSPTPHHNGIALPAGTLNTLMSVTVEASGGPVGVSVRAYTADGTMKEAAYEGFDTIWDTGETVEVPIALKTEDGYYTHILFSNPKGEEVDVTVEYRGNTGTHIVTRTLQPFGVDNHSTYSDSVVPSGFVGSAVVRATGPVAVVVFRAKKINPASELDEDLYTSLNGIPHEMARDTVYFPMITRRISAGGGYSGINSWMSISVPGGGPAKIEIRATGRCGAGSTTQTYVTNTTIVDSQVFYQNAETNTGLGAAPPACFFGAVTVTSDVPIVGTASYIDDRYRGDGEGVYNGWTFVEPPRD